MLQNKGQVDLQDVIRCKNRSTFTNFVFQILMSRICNMGIFIVCSNLEVKYQPTRKNSLLYKKKNPVFSLFSYVSFKCKLLYFDDHFIYEHIECH